MARNLRVHADVVKRSGRDRGDDGTAVCAAVGRRAVISALPGCYCSDDQPYQQDKPSDSHSYLRMTGSSCSSEELRTRNAPTATPPAADTRGRRMLCPASPAFADTRAARFTRRCIVSADGPGRQDRPARICGTRSAHPSAGSPAGRRWPAAPIGRSHVVYVHH